MNRWQKTSLKTKPGLKGKTKDEKKLEVLGTFPQVSKTLKRFDFVWFLDVLINNKAISRTGPKTDV